jgi:hypothetical protein
MANPWSDLGVTDAEFRAAIDSPELNQAKLELAEKVKDYWKSIAPEDTGAYRDSIHIEIGADAVRVVADDEAASYIEFGTSDTPEFATRAKTAAKFARED